MRSLSTNDCLTQSVISLAPPRHSIADVAATLQSTPLRAVVGAHLLCVLPIVKATELESASTVFHTTRMKRGEGVGSVKLGIFTFLNTFLLSQNNVAGELCKLIDVAKMFLKCRVCDRALDF